MANPESEITVEEQLPSTPYKNAIPQFEESVENLEVEVNPQHIRSCKPKCKARKFSSKAALMVLIWNIVTNTIFGSLDSLVNLFDSSDDDPSSYLVYRAVTDVVPFVLLLLTALLSGWLADTYLGHYRVAKIGLFLAFASAVLQCLLVVAIELSDEEWSFGLRTFLATFVASLGYGSLASLLVTLPQVGLNQMPDCTTESITSFIAWYVASFFIGFWIGEFAPTIGYSCVGNNFLVVSSLLPVVLMSLVLISDIFLSPKWLIAEQKTMKSLKIIYKVLRFAAKHKAPVNRSALTYWEEDIPPRIDLGKSRYGGPFTTEQVEDVKTLFRILLLTIPLWISLLSFYLYSNIIALLEADPTIVFGNATQHCSTQVLQYFTYSWFWLAIIVTISFEVTIYPLFGHRFPSSIRRMGASTLMIVIGNTLCFFLAVYYYLHPYIPEVIAYVHSLGVAVMVMAILTSSVEFICAQSPYNMRGVLIGYIWCINSCTLGVAQTVFYTLNDDDYQRSVVVLLYSGVATLLSVVSFVVFCTLARWYKRRKRDDIATPYKWAEDYYDRYLPPNAKPPKTLK